MVPTTPQWLRAHGGDLKLGSDGQTWFVYFGHDPDYSLRAVPASGNFGCVVRQTNNGKRLEGAPVSSSASDAILGGLETLREELGW